MIFISMCKPRCKKYNCTKQKDSVNVLLVILINPQNDPFANSTSLLNTIRNCNNNIPESRS